jgi:hypothetical protein
MKIIFTKGTNNDDEEYQELKLLSDNGEHLYELSAYESIAPEDCRFYRELQSCDGMLDAIKLGYNAGKNGEELIIQEIIEQE